MFDHKTQNNIFISNEVVQMANKKSIYIFLTWRSIGYERDNTLREDRND